MEKSWISFSPTSANFSLLSLLMRMSRHRSPLQPSVYAHRIRTNGPRTSIHLVSHSARFAGAKELTDRLDFDSVRRPHGRSEVEMLHMMYRTMSLENRLLRK